MQPKESLYPKDWFATAEKDLKRAKVLLASCDYEGAGFHLQQAIEKYLKGYLISKGWKLKRIHDLEALLNATITYNKAFEDFRLLCLKVTNYYIEERYPFLVASDISKKDLEDSLRLTMKLIELLKNG